MDDALGRYYEDRFTDEDVTTLTGLFVRAFRELSKAGAVRTITERRSAAFADAIPRPLARAAIGALNKAGLSLFVCGQIAYFLPLHTSSYEICDPCRISP